jgi:hypothetical protein
MGLGVSLLLVAVGAVLTWAIDPTGETPVNLGVVGVVLMLVGLVGFLLSLLFWSSWAGPGARNRRAYVADAGPDVVVDERPRYVERRVVERPARRRTTVVEHDGPDAY